MVIVDTTTNTRRTLPFKDPPAKIFEARLSRVVFARRVNRISESALSFSSRGAGQTLPVQQRRDGARGRGGRLDPAVARGPLAQEHSIARLPSSSGKESSRSLVCLEQSMMVRILETLT